MGTCDKLHLEAVKLVNQIKGGLAIVTVTLTRHHLTPRVRLKGKDKKEDFSEWNILKLKWHKHRLFHNLFGLETIEESAERLWKEITGEDDMPADYGQVCRRLRGRKKDSLVVHQEVNGFFMRNDKAWVCRVLARICKCKKRRIRILAVKNLDDLKKQKYPGRNAGKKRLERRVARSRLRQLVFNPAN